MYLLEGKLQQKHRSHHASINLILTMVSTLSVYQYQYLEPFFSITLIHFCRWQNGFGWPEIGLRVFSREVCWASYQSYIVVFQSGQALCVNGQWCHSPSMNHKNYFVTLWYKNRTVIVRHMSYSYLIVWGCENDVVPLLGPPLSKIQFIWKKILAL